MDPNTIEQAQALWKALTNENTHISPSAEELVIELRAGRAPILVELPWGEVRGTERFERHQIVLSHVDERRVYFNNGLKTDLPPGSVIEGPESGPERRVEPNGEESMDLVRFVALFARGGKAMLKG